MNKKRYSILNMKNGMRICCTDNIGYDTTVDGLPALRVTMSDLEFPIDLYPRCPKVSKMDKIGMFVGDSLGCEDFHLVDTVENRSMRINIVGYGINDDDTIFVDTLRK